MRGAYRVLAFIIAGFVAFQSAVIAFAVFGLASYLEGGGVIDFAAQQTASFTGEVGFMLHGIVGQMLIPLLGLLLVIFSFFAKVPGGVKWALFVFASIVVQVVVAIIGGAGLGLLHGLNALVLFGLAVTAGMRVKRVTAGTVSAGSAPAAV